MNHTIIFLLIATCISVECGILDRIKEEWKRIIKPKLRIIHGLPVIKGEHPSIVSIRENNVHICGGNIISEDVILTAAHCTINHDSSVWEAIAGIIKLDDISENNVQRVKITKVIVHPHFDRQSSLFDIAIAKVLSRFTFTPSVNYIYLHVTPHLPGLGEIIGWGATRDNGPISNILLKTHIEIKTKEQCIEEFGSDIELGLLCAQTSHGDACFGDSGGPLVCDSNELCGIISSGKGCGSESGSALYTDVSYFIDWILSESSLKKTKNK